MHETPVYIEENFGLAYSVDNVDLYSPQSMRSTYQGHASHYWDPNKLRGTSHVWCPQAAAPWKPVMDRTVPGRGPPMVQEFDVCYILREGTRECTNIATAKAGLQWSRV